MSDHRISLCASAAIVMWVTALMMMLGATLENSLLMAAWSLIAAAIAATVSVRAFLCQQQTVMRDSFELGRDARLHHLR